MTENEGKSKRVKMQEVIVIKADKETATVEYILKGRVFRKLIPSDKLKGNKVSADELELGVDYGVPWASELNMKATPQRVENNLHRMGIWTSDDAFSHPDIVMGAIQAAYGVELASIFAAATKYRLKEV